jgi:uncharacterized RDD family membrane protein YckC
VRDIATIGDPAPTLGGLGVRAVAVIVDSLVLIVVLGFLFALLFGRAKHGNGSASFNLSGWRFFAWGAASLAYFIVFEALTGATLGKRLMSLRVVREDGSPLTWEASFVRNLLRLVDGLFFYLVGFFVAWSSPRRQRLGDRFAQTLVVRA